MLLDSSGNVVATKNADSLGGLLFRNVAPSLTSYVVKDDGTGAVSDPLVVHDTTAAPWDPSIYDQSIPDNGYTYLTTRDGTKLAIDVQAPTPLPACPSLRNEPCRPYQAIANKAAPS